MFFVSFHDRGLFLVLFVFVLFGFYIPGYRSYRYGEAPEVLVFAGGLIVCIFEFDLVIGFYVYLIVIIEPSYRLCKVLFKVLAVDKFCGTPVNVLTVK